MPVYVGYTHSSVRTHSPFYINTPVLFLKLHTSHFGPKPHKRCNISSMDGFLSRRFKTSSQFLLSRHTSQTAQEVNQVSFEQKSRSLHLGASVPGSFLKLKISNFSHMRQKRRRFGCDRSILMTTFLGEQNTFLVLFSVSIGVTILLHYALNFSRMRYLRIKFVCEQ